MALLIHLPSRRDWHKFAGPDGFAPPSLRLDGFLHLSRASEAVMVANLMFRHVDDLLAVVVDSRRLTELRLEPERPGGFAWPHLHGPLPFDSVMAVLDYPREASGRFGPLSSRLSEFDAGDPIRFHEPMTPGRCLDALNIIATVGVSAAVDGGWAVDAALCEVTREHGDLDLCVPETSLDDIVGALERAGYRVTEDQLPTRLELRAQEGYGAQIDLHPLTFDDLGNGIQKLNDGTSFMYPARGLAGAGQILSRPVHCITPDLQVECHLGYEPDEDDYKDVAALCARFNLVAPPPYGRAVE